MGTTIWNPSRTKAYACLSFQHPAQRKHLPRAATESRSTKPVDAGLVSPGAGLTGTRAGQQTTSSVTAEAESGSILERLGLLANRWRLGSLHPARPS